MASSWGLARGKTGVIVTVGEAIASKVPEAVTTTVVADIPAEAVLPALAEILLPTGPARRVAMADPPITTALVPKSRLAIVGLPITTALTAKWRIAVLGVPLMAVGLTTAAAVHATSSCPIYGVATSANDLRPALIAGLAPDVSSDFEFMTQLLVASANENGG